MRSFASRNRRAGFSLMEMAIVLLLIGLVVGAVWVAAAHVLDNSRIQKATQQVNTSVENIRQYYMNAQSFAASGDITAALDNLSLFPVEMRETPGTPGGPVDHAIGTFAGGSFHIVSENCPMPAGGMLNCFRVRLLGLGKSDCIKMLQSIPVGDIEMGIVQMGTQNMTGGAATILVPPPLSSAIAGWCNLSGATNEADWDYKLHN